jgi:hypothetical protein
MGSSTLVPLTIVIAPCLAVLTATRTTASCPTGIAGTIESQAVRGRGARGIRAVTVAPTIGPLSVLVTVPCNTADGAGDSRSEVVSCMIGTLCPGRVAEIGGPQSVSRIGRQSHNEEPEPLAVV